MAKPLEKFSWRCYELGHIPIIAVISLITSAVAIPLGLYAFWAGTIVDTRGRLIVGFLIVLSVSIVLDRSMWRAASKV